MPFPLTRNPLTRTITAAGQTFVIPCSRATLALVQMVAAALVGHDCAIEGSMDSTTGADGNWFAVSAARSNAPGTLEAATGPLAATPGYMWRVNCAGLKFIRFRSTGHTSGSAAYSAMLLDIDGEPK